MNTFIEPKTSGAIAISPSRESKKECQEGRDGSGAFLDSPAEERPNRNIDSVTPPLVPAHNHTDLPMIYHDTAIADLLAYHNRGAPHQEYTQAKLLVGMCMDHRKRLRIPENFAYIIRSAGTNLRALQFQISFAIAVRGVRDIAIIGHDQCGMSDLSAQREELIAGLVNGVGWEQDVAEQHFDEFAPRFEIGDPVEFTRAQARHLRQQYPTLTVAALLYRLDDGMLHCIDADEEARVRGTVKSPRQGGLPTLSRDALESPL